MQIITHNQNADTANRHLGIVYENKKNLPKNYPPVTESTGLQTIRQALVFLRK